MLIAYRNFMLEEASRNQTNKHQKFSTSGEMNDFSIKDRSTASRSVDGVHFRSSEASVRDEDQKKRNKENLEILPRMFPNLGNRMMLDRYLPSFEARSDMFGRAYGRRMLGNAQLGEIHEQAKGGNKNFAQVSKNPPKFSSKDLSETTSIILSPTVATLPRTELFSTKRSDLSQSKNTTIERPSTIEKPEIEVYQRVPVFAPASEELKIAPRILDSFGNRRTLSDTQDPKNGSRTLSTQKPTTQIVTEKSGVEISSRMLNRMGGRRTLRATQEPEIEIAPRFLSLLKPAFKKLDSAIASKKSDLEISNRMFDSIGGRRTLTAESDIANRFMPMEAGAVDIATHKSNDSVAPKEIEPRISASSNDGRTLNLSEVDISPRLLSINLKPEGLEDRTKDNNSSAVPTMNTVVDKTTTRIFKRGNDTFKNASSEDITKNEGPQSKDLKVNGNDQSSSRTILNKTGSLSDEDSPSDVALRAFQLNAGGSDKVSRKINLGF